METFFKDDSLPRYWLCNASIAQIACSASWPPVIAVTGYAPCVRAWAPTSRDEPEFRPVQQLLEVDGERFVACTVKGDLLVAADSSASGRISIWDTTTWTRQQTLTAGAPVTALDASRTYIAAGTSAGYVRVWKRQSPTDATFAQFFVPDLQLDSLPVCTVRLGPLRMGGPGAQAGGGGGAGGGGDGGSSGDCVMVVHTRGNGRVSAWRLSDAKIIGTLGRGGSVEPAEALLSANVQHAVLARDCVLMTCSWLPGKEPLLQWIHPVQRTGGEVPGVTQHLAGVSKPLCCDYDGFLIVMGCEDGMVWVWGLLQGQQPTPPQQPPQQQQPGEVGHWRGYHRGAVGAVACLPHRGGQVASAGADGCVKLWSPTGQLLAVARLGWQVTSMAVNELALVVGGAEGQLQILVLLTEEQAAAHESRPTEEERREAATPPAGRGAGAVPQLGYWFDARTPKQAAAAASGSGSAAAGVWGSATEHSDAFAAFVPPRRQVTLADLQQQQQQQQGGAAGSGSADGGSGNGGDGSSASGSGNGRTAGAGAGPSSSDAAAAGAAAEAEAGAGAALANGKASSFNMRAAIKGAQRSAADQAAALAAEEEAKRTQLRAMGEGPGVARSRGAVHLEGATAALGRKCSNPSCLQREGLAELRQGGGGGGGGSGFKRCGACRSVVYCSAHCQSTHWRDGHKKECPQLAEAWRQQQAAEEEAVAAALASTNTDGAGGTGGGVSGEPAACSEAVRMAEAGTVDGACATAVAASSGGLVGTLPGSGRTDGSPSAGAAGHDCLTELD